jgi:hypothetical protein
MERSLHASLEVLSGTPFFWDVTHEDESTKFFQRVWNQLPSGIASHPRRMSHGTFTFTAITFI